MHQGRSGWIHKWFVREPPKPVAELEQRPWLRIEGNQRLRVRLPTDWAPTQDDCAVAAVIVLDDGMRYVVTFHRLPARPPQRPRPRIVYSRR